MRNIIIVGDEGTARVLAYAPVDWEVHTASNVESFMDRRRNSSLPSDPDAVIFTDMTGNTLREVLNAAGTMVLARIPTAIIAFLPETIATVEANYDRLASQISDLHAEKLKAREAQGFAVTESERRNPIDVTPLILTSALNGVGGVIKALAPAMSNPLPVEQVEALPSKFFLPLLSPVVQHFAPKPTARKATVLAVVSDKGGCGKTSTSLLLGAAIAVHTFQSGSPKSVVVVDLDRQSQMRGHYPSATSDITLLRANSNEGEVASALFSVPQIPNLSVLLGAENTGEHLALRSVELYRNVVDYLTVLFDVVILDCSVGTTSDDVTMWAQQEADGIYYILDQSGESLGLAQAARDNAFRSVEEGGLGVAEDKWRVVVNRARYAKGNALRDAWDEAVNERLGDQVIEAIIPDSHPEVSDAKDQGRLVELAQTSPTLSPVLFEMTKRLFPEVRDVSVTSDQESPRKRRFGGLR